MRTNIVWHCRFPQGKWRWRGGGPLKSVAKFNVYELIIYNKITLIILINTMTANYYFAIVGHADNPLFEIEFNNSGKDAKVSCFL